MPANGPKRPEHWPQIMTFNLAFNAIPLPLVAGDNGLFLVTQIPVPVQRLNQPSGKAMVLEILWVEYTPTNIRSATIEAASVAQAHRVNFVLMQTAGTAILSGITAVTGGNIGTLAAAQGNPTMISKYINSITCSKNAAANDGFVTISDADSYTYTDELQSDDGYGILVATDSLTFISGAMISTTAAALPTNDFWDNGSGYTVRVCYRWVNVSLQEYIGIVQSQQAQT